MNSANLSRDAFLSHAEACLADGLYRVALDSARERLQLLPGDVDARMILCRAYLVMGNLEEAKRSLAAIEDVSAGLAVIYAGLGDLCRETGLLQEGAGYYSLSAALNRDVGQERGASLQDYAGSLPADESGAGHGEEGYEDIRDLSSDFHTLTLAELYIRQGHLGMAADVLEEILRRDPENREAAELLRTVRAKREDIPVGHGPQAVVAELTRWWKNIERIRIHAG